MVLIRDYITFSFNLYQFSLLLNFSTSLATLQQEDIDAQFQIPHLSKWFRAFENGDRPDSLQVQLQSLTTEILYEETIVTSCRTERLGGMSCTKDFKFSKPINTLSDKCCPTIPIICISTC